MDQQFGPCEAIYKTSYFFSYFIIFLRKTKLSTLHSRNVTQKMPPPHLLDFTMEIVGNIFHKVNNVNVNLTFHTELWCNVRPDKHILSRAATTSALTFAQDKICRVFFSKKYFCLIFSSSLIHSV